MKHKNSAGPLSYPRPVEMGRVKGPRLRRKKTCDSVRQQMEFYFSDANLQKDRFLKQEIEQQEDRYVTLATFLNFNKIQSLTTDIDVLKWAVSKSEVLELSSDKKLVRRTTPFTGRSAQEVDECTVYVESLPPTADHDWLKQMFSPHGEVAYISLPRYKTTGDIKGFAFIEYKTKEEAEQACTANQSADIEPEKAGRFPKYNKQILTINKQISVSQHSEGKQRPRRRRNTSDSSGGGGDTQDEGGAKRARDSSGEPTDGDQGSKGSWINRGGRKRSKSNSSVSDLETSAEKPASGDTNRSKRKRKRSGVDPEQTDEPQEKAKKKSLSEGDSKAETVTAEQGETNVECSRQGSAPTEQDASGTKEDILKDGGEPSQQAGVVPADKEISTTKSEAKPDVKNFSLESKVKHGEETEKPRSGKQTEKPGSKILSEEAVTDAPETTGKREQQECKEVPLESSEDNSGKVEESDDSLKGVIVDKSKRKRVSDGATGEEGEKEVKPKRVRINEEVDVQEPTVAVGKKRRKRRQNKDQKEKVPESKPKLKVIPKQEWLRLRKEYLSLQKESMTALKKSLKKVSHQQHQHEGQTAMETKVEENVPEKPEKGEASRPQFEFTAGVIIKATSTEPLRRKELKEQLSAGGEIAYIDLMDGTNEAHIRCKTPEDAQKIVALDQKIVSMNLLDGESETRYWEKMSEDRERTLSNRKRTKKSGAKKLIEKAERMIVQGVPKKHIVFSVDGEPEPV